MSVTRFYEIEKQLLEIEAEKVAMFTKHPALVGSYREYVLRDYIRRFTPSQIEVGAGFVCDYHNAFINELFSAQTRQIDCLVYDSRSFTPFLRARDFAIVQPESMFAAIEIKSSLSLFKTRSKSDVRTDDFPLKDCNGYFRWDGTVVDAMANIVSVNRTCARVIGHSFSAIFSYSSTFNPSLLRSAFAEGLLNQLGVVHLVELPECICILKNGAFTLLPTDPSVEDVEFDSSVAHLNWFSCIRNSDAATLRFFTMWYHNTLKYRLNGEPPHKHGMFTGAIGGGESYNFKLCLDSSGLYNKETINWTIGSGASRPSVGPTSS